MARKHQFDSPVNALAAYLLIALLISLATPVSAADAPFPVETQLVDSQHYPYRPAMMRPVRRDGPLRELNVSDNEVREIQSITLAVLPGAVVNISGVVTGCPCEEGPACSDQVWVVAHRPGHSQGLQLSRVNGHWGISVVQQWWLNFEELQVVRMTAPDVYAESLQNLYASYPVCTNPPADSQ